MRLRAPNNDPHAIALAVAYAGCFASFVPTHWTRRVFGGIFA